MQIIRVALIILLFNRFRLIRDLCDIRRFCDFELIEVIQLFGIQAFPQIATRQRIWWQTTDWWIVQSRSICLTLHELTAVWFSKRTLRTGNVWAIIGTVQLNLLLGGTKGTFAVVLVSRHFRVVDCF